MPANQLLRAFTLITTCIFVVVLSLSASARNYQPTPNGTRSEHIYRKLMNARVGMFVVAHRGCHNPSPADHLPSAPENSLAALDHCVALGVDMMELDVRRTKDGALVIMHDDTVDRTTNGSGRVGDLTLAEIEKLRLKQNFGGLMSPTLSDQKVPNLNEMLEAAKGRIMLNLDIKDDIYPDVIAAALAAGMQRGVLVKKEATVADPPLADVEPYGSVPFMAIVASPASGSAPSVLANTVVEQTSSRHHLVGVEMVLLRQLEFDAVSETARRAKVRLWANTLNEVGMLSLIDAGGDIESLRSGGSAWGYLIRHGVNVIQTDEPGPLIRYLKGAHLWR